MLTNLKSALIAWSASAVLVGIGYSTAELVFEPAVEGQTEAHDADGGEDSEKVDDHGGPEKSSADAANVDAGSKDGTDAENNAASASTDTPPAGDQAASTEAAPSDVINYTHRDEDIIEKARHGDLPKVTPEGKRASKVYASAGPLDPELPRISVILTEIGLRSRVTQRALDNLPSDVTLAFSPYGSKLNEWAAMARTKGHEILLMVPMEPVDIQKADPGPLALLVNQSPRTNVDLLRTSFGRMTGYVGAINHMGSRFTAVQENLRPVLSEINRRGLIYVDSRSTQHSQGAALARAMRIPTAINNRYIDRELTPEAVADQLAELENRAKTLGAAVGMGRVTPLAINAVVKWAENLGDRGFVLVPITHITDRQPLPR